MKLKQVQELRTKSLVELKKEADEKRTETVKVRAEIVTGREKNIKRLKNLRHDLAQILTIMKEIEILEAKLPQEKNQTDKKSV